MKGLARVGFGAIVGLLLGACQPGAGPDTNAENGSTHRSSADLQAMLCSNPDESESALLELKVLDEHGPTPSPELLIRLRDFVDEREHAGWCHDKFRKSNIRLTGPIVRVSNQERDRALDSQTELPVTAFGTHARVRVYYSKAMVSWLQAGRKGAVPDGAMMVKEMYPSPTVKPGADPDVPDGWALMVRDSRSTRDGWLWFLRYRPDNSAYSMPFQGGQYGNAFCLSCHAAAKSEQTFSALGNLIEEDVPTYLTLEDPGAKTLQSASSGIPIPRRLPTTHGRIPMPSGMFDGMPSSNAGGDWPYRRCKTAKTMEEFWSCILYSPILLPESSPQQPFMSLFEPVAPNVKALAQLVPEPLPMDGMVDHLPPGHEETPMFMTASACNACHDASDLVNGTNPEMSVPANEEQGAEAFDRLVIQDLLGQPTRLSLSPVSEWNGSLMSVSARDPVFRAQLEAEVERYPDHAEETTSLCLSCHAPMGQRQYPELAGDLANTLKVFHEDSAKEAAFGALARDGVSCAVCHHISDEELGEPTTFNAKFKLGDPEQIYGPFAEEIQLDPMQTALGLTPTHAPHIESSGLCGSCHMVEPPVLDNPEKDSAHEQTTYLEWRSSSYSKADSDDYQSCQDCHMRNTQPQNRDELTRGKIANYEDSTFPFTANRKASPLTDTVDRDGYGRHTLLGLNLFTMNFFQQFPYQLGSQTFGPQRAFADLVAPRALATYEVQKTAQHQTASIQLEPIASEAGELAIGVAVRSLVGHKFPTGVGFRRAFIELQVLDKAGKRLWCSGCTNEVGVIVDNAGQPLAEETPRENNRWLPDYQEIVSDQQAQVYETRHTNAAGELTTSFLELNNEVKDNRILPKGWDDKDYPEFALAPVAASLEAEPEVDRVVYRIPKSALAGAHSIRARLYYQALPPYYLLDRMSLLESDSAQEHPETQRLLHLLTRLNLRGNKHAVALIEDWKLAIGEPASLTLLH